MTHFSHASSAISFLVFVGAALLLPGSACSRPSPTVDDFNPMLQEHTTPAIGEAKDEAAGVAMPAPPKTDEPPLEARQDGAETNRRSGGEGSPAQTNANVEVRAANRKTAKATCDLREWSQTRIDDLDDAIDAAHAKEQTAAPERRAAFEVGIKAVEVRRNALRFDIASIETQSPTEMDEFKDRFDKEGNQLTHRVEDLSGAL